MGSMNGWGVFSSKNIGRLMATLDPRRVRMFAVSVLYKFVNLYDKKRWPSIRETCMRIGDLLGQEETVT